MSLAPRARTVTWGEEPTAARHYLSAQYDRLVARRGAKRAVVAVAHTILIIVYHLLRDGTTYQELGADYFDDGDRSDTVHRAVYRIERLGYSVTLKAS